MEIKRKIYKDLLKWKQESQGKKALLIEGARRVGKSTIAEKFGRRRVFSREVLQRARRRAESGLRQIHPALS